jgi:hypothetical protein
MPVAIDTQVINVTISVDSALNVTVPQQLSVVGVNVELTSPQDGDELYYDSTNSVWKNRRGRVILTQAEYDALTPDPDVLYYIKEI